MIDRSDIDMGTPPEFGILLPHFGPHASPSFVIQAARQAAEVGFDSVWVRDHLYVPHERRQHGGITEGRFIESLQTLSLIAGATEGLTVGTSSLNPHRHPLKLSQCLGTLDFLADGDVICGIGAGTFRGEFDAVDLPYERRGQLVEENMEILRRTFTEERVSYDGELFSFDDVTIDPRPGIDLPIWYGGLAPVAVKRAVKYADGWLPGRMPLEKIDERLDLLDTLEERRGKSLSLGYITIYSPAETGDAARAKLNLTGLIDDVSELLAEDYETVDDIEGSFIAGDPAECVTQIRALLDRGFEHIILDMRHSFGEMIEMLELTGDHVLPQLR